MFAATGRSPKKIPQILIILYSAILAAGLSFTTSSALAATPHFYSTLKPRAQYFEGFAMRCSDYVRKRGKTLYTYKHTHENQTIDQSHQSETGWFSVILIITSLARPKKICPKFAL